MRETEKRERGRERELGYASVLHLCDRCLRVFTELRVHLDVIEALAVAALMFIKET